MGRLLERLEGLFLLALGTLTLMLSAGDSYLSFMNPRYRWMTIASGAVLCAIGILTTALPRHEHHWSRSLAFIPFVAVFLFALSDAEAIRGTPAVMPESRPAPPPYVVSSDALAPGGEARKRLEPPGYAGYREGAPPVPINTAELFLLADSGDAVKISRPYVVRGIVHRSPALDDRASFALLRTFIYCCAVDATDVGFVVPWKDAQALKDGQWVRVTGRLKRASAPQDMLSSVKPRGAYFTTLNPGYVFRADGVEQTKAPDVPFVYEMRESEPYAY